MSNAKRKGFSTRAVHGGRGYTGNTGAVMPPVYMTSTFQQGNPDGFDYTRDGNPNFRLLQESFAALEEAKYATCFASGVSAITAIVSSLKSGDVIVSEENIYSCTHRMFEQVFAKFGVKTLYFDMNRSENWEQIRAHQPALVWLESPTNPLLKILDIAGIAKLGAPVVVDNTFASPFLQRPLELGATLSVTSTTKYGNGHSDCLAGIVATNDPSWHKKMLFAQKALGLQPSPFDAWLTTRGQRTLAVRMERHCANALQLAGWLEQHPRVRWVRYPFLPSHPQHALAKQQMSGGSGMVTFEMEGDALPFCRKLELFTLAASLGGVESLVCHPATMMYAARPKSEREQLGITAGVVRLSVGIEDVNDLIADIEQAL
jgi:cystathionine gamma-synthase